MRCTGRFLYRKQEYSCDKEWSCRHYSFRTKGRETHKSKEPECQLYEKIVLTT